MEKKMPVPAKAETVNPDEELQPISIRKLDRIETTHLSYANGN
jgi:hypothetical protein